MEEMDMEFFLRGKYGSREYDGAPPISARPAERKDHRWLATTMLTKKFLRHYFVTAHVSYMNIDSNIQANTYDKVSGGLDLGVNLDF